MTDNSLKGFDPKTILENLGSGLLIFNADDKLVFNNSGALELLGSKLESIKKDGWSALAAIIDSEGASEHSQNLSATEVRSKLSDSKEPVPFNLPLVGASTPCRAISATDKDGKSGIIITIERPNWDALTELMGAFRAEGRSAVTSSAGHAEFIRKLLENPPDKITIKELGKRAVGMINLISTDMYNLQLFIDLLHRLEVIRTGQLNEVIKSKSQQIAVGDFIEDFVEELNEQNLLDPNISTESTWSRLVIDVEDDVNVNAPKTALRDILRDLLRNALMYSEDTTKVTIRAKPAAEGQQIEFSIIDEGCGIREKERERVFRPFERARQPHIMRESGYGLSLYLAKAEIETMGGSIKFESEEGTGTTFSFNLPAATG